DLLAAQFTHRAHAFVHVGDPSHPRWLPIDCRRRCMAGQRNRDRSWIALLPYKPRGVFGLPRESTLARKGLGPPSRGRTQAMVWRARGFNMSWARSPIAWLCPLATGATLVVVSQALPAPAAANAPVV